MLVQITDIRQREPGKPLVEKLQEQYGRLGLLNRCPNVDNGRQRRVLDAETGEVIAETCGDAAEKFRCSRAWISRAAKRRVRIRRRLLRIER